MASAAVAAGAAEAAAGSVATEELAAAAAAAGVLGAPASGSLADTPFKAALPAVVSGMRGSNAGGGSTDVEYAGGRWLGFASSHMTSVPSTSVLVATPRGLSVLATTVAWGAALGGRCE